MDISSMCPALLKINTGARNSLSQNKQIFLLFYESLGLHLIFYCLLKRKMKSEKYKVKKYLLSM